jgi:hypothetical protein
LPLFSGINMSEEQTYIPWNDSKEEEEEEKSER